MSDPIRIVVADDHPMFRAGVVGTLGSYPDIQVVAEADDADTAAMLVRHHLPDVALLDITMPGGGLRAAREIGVACPATRVVMLTASEDELTRSRDWVRGDLSSDEDDEPQPGRRINGPRGNGTRAVFRHRYFKLSRSSR